MNIDDIINYESNQYKVWFIDQDNQVVHLVDINNENNGICVEITQLNNQ